MSLRSLGTLTLDMVLKLAGFTGPLDKAGRDARKRADQMKKDFASLGKVVAGLGTAAAGGLYYMTTSLASSAREIENLSRLAGASTDEFQKLSFGAKRFGVEQDKVADILKDTQDKIGDFLNTGGGPLKDFFEQVAPKIGVTAEQFKKLSGPDALQLYVSSLEKAGASQQDFTFYMEAIASDSTLLLPLLKDNGKALKDLGTEAEKTGNVLSKLDFENLRKVSESTDKLQSAFKGMGNEIVLSALPAINDLTEILGDEQTIEAAKSLGYAVVVSIKAATEVIQGATNATRYLAESIAAMVNGPALDDIVRVEDRIQSLQEKMTGFRQFRANQSDFSKELDEFFGLDGLERFKAWEDELAKLEAARDAFYKAKNRTSKTDAPDNVTPPTGSSGGSGIKGISGALSDEQEKSAKALQDQVDALKLQANTLGMSASAMTVYKLALEGASASQLEQAAAALQSVESFESQAEAAKKAADAQKEINSQASGIAESLMSEEEKIKESYRRRSEIVLANTQITGDARINLLRQLGEKEQAEIDDLNAGYWERYLKATEENLQSFDKLTESVINNFSSGFGNAFESIIFDSQNLGDAISNLAEGMARSVVNALGQMAAQWLAYQAVQILVGKSTQAAAASGMTSNALAMQQQAALAAFASTAAIPIVGPIAAPGAAVAAIAATTPFVAAITAFSAAGMAHEGIDSIPKTGTWLLEKGERVTTEKTSAKLDRTLSDIQKKRSGGDNISVINQTTGRVDNAATQRLSNGDLAIILQEVAGSFANPNSDISRSMSAYTTARRSR